MMMIAKFLAAGLELLALKEVSLASFFLIHEPKIPQELKEK